MVGSINRTNWISNNRWRIFAVEILDRAFVSSDKSGVSACVDSPRYNGELSFEPVQLGSPHKKPLLFFVIR
jgi:hypothetical protein